MELVQELLTTALFVLVFSFIVAKLISKAVVTGGDRHDSTQNLYIQTVSNSDGGLKHDSSKTTKRVRFVEEVEEFEIERSQEYSESCDAADRKIAGEEATENSSEEFRCERVDDEGGAVELGSGLGMVSEEEDDDWEGIERSELEKEFGAAVNFVGFGGKENNGLGNDVEMQLYALQKVAMEGACYEPQPMPLKLSARAKWNAWQSLGNMSLEVAMEQYITLLSDRVPGWSEGNSSGDGKQDSLESGLPNAQDSNVSTFVNKQPNSIKESEIELKTEAGEGEGIVGSNIMNKDKK